MLFEDGSGPLLDIAQQALAWFWLAFQSIGLVGG